MREASIRRLAVCLLTVPTFLLACPDGAAADEGAEPVVVEVDECPHFERGGVLHLLRVDLGARFRSSSSEDTFVLQVECQPDGVLIQAGRARGTPLTVRSLESDEVGGDVGARVLALKAVELLRELENAAPEEEAPLVVEPGRSPPLALSLRLLFGGEILSFGLEPPLLGGEGALEILMPQVVYFRLGGGAAANRRQFALGEVDSLLISFRAEAGARFPVGASGFGAGLGYRFGYARVRGKAKGADQLGGAVSGLWGGPYGAIFSDTRVGGRLTFRVGAELGGVLSPVVGTIDGQEDVSVAGLWGGVSALVGVAF